MTTAKEDNDDNQHCQLLLVLVEKLLQLRCEPIRNVFNTESSITLTQIMSDPTYFHEKLDTFIWLIIKFESSFSGVFTDSEFFAVDKKTKLICHTLTQLGMMRPLDQNKQVENFINKSQNAILAERNLRTLSELTDLCSYQQDLVNEQQHRIVEQQNQQAMFQAGCGAGGSIEDLSMLVGAPSSLFSSNNLNLNETSSAFYEPTPMLATSTSPPAITLDDLLGKKLQALDDENFLAGFRQVIGDPTSGSSLIPNSLSRFIKNMINNSDDSQDNSTLQIGSTLAIATLVDERIEIVERAARTQRAELLKTESTASNENELVQIEKQCDDATKLSSLNQRMKQLLGEIDRLTPEISQFVVANNALFIGNDKDNDSSASAAGLDLGRRFYEFDKCLSEFNETKSRLGEWANRLEKRKANEAEYETSSSLIKHKSVPTILQSIDVFDSEIDKYLGWMGKKMINLDA